MTEHGFLAVMLAVVVAQVAGLGVGAAAFLEARKVLSQSR